MNIFSIITVRKGSKGLKNKCTRKIKDKAVFKYVIKYSLELNHELKGKIFTVVSSDSDVVKEYCFKNNIYFIKRKPSLSTGFTQIEEVIYSAYRKIDRRFDYISLLYGNIPTRYKQEFLRAYNFLRKNKDYHAVLSFQNVEKYNPSWMFPLSEEILPMKKNEGYRRQDLKQFMIHDGHTILFRSKYFLEFMRKGGIRQKKGLYDAFGAKIKPLLNKSLIIDIDTERDLELAEAFIYCKNVKTKNDP